MASGAFFSRVEVKPTDHATGLAGIVLLHGDHVVTYCGDGSRVGVIECFETHTKFTAGRCVVEDVHVAFVRDLKTGEVSEAMPHLLKLAPGWEPPPPDFDADSDYGVLNYFRQRSKLLAGHGWERYTSPRPIEDWGCVATYYREVEPATPGDPTSIARREVRYAVFVRKSHRRRGHLRAYLTGQPTMKFITLDDCNVADFYKKHGRDVLVIKAE
jgi:hypothetical protein